MDLEEFCEWSLHEAHSVKADLQFMSTKFAIHFAHYLQAFEVAAREHCQQQFGEGADTPQYTAESIHDVNDIYPFQTFISRSFEKQTLEVQKVVTGSKLPFTINEGAWLLALLVHLNQHKTFGQDT